MSRFCFLFVLLFKLNKGCHIAVSLWAGLVELFLGTPGVSFFWSVGVPEKILPGSLHLLLGWGQVGGAGSKGGCPTARNAKGIKDSTCFSTNCQQIPLFQSTSILSPTPTSRDPGGWQFPIL